MSSCFAEAWADITTVIGENRQSAADALEAYMTGREAEAAGCAAAPAHLEMLGRALLALTAAATAQCPRRRARACAHGGRCRPEGAARHTPLGAWRLNKAPVPCHCYYTYWRCGSVPTVRCLDAQAAGTTSCLPPGFQALLNPKPAATCASMRRSRRHGDHPAPMLCSQGPVIGACADKHVRLVQGGPVLQQRCRCGRSGARTAACTARLRPYGAGSI